MRAGHPIAVKDAPAQEEKARPRQACDVREAVALHLRYVGALHPGSSQLRRFCITATPALQ